MLLDKELKTASYAVRDAAYAARHTVRYAARDAARDAARYAASYAVSYAAYASDTQVKQIKEVACY